MQNELDELIWVDHFLAEAWRVDTRLRVSEWAELKRFLPQGLTSMPGPWRNEVTPYLTEIMDCFSMSSPVQKVAIMKGTQLGFTVGVGENWIGYMIDDVPGPMLFVSGDKTMAEAAIEVRVDRMIETAGLGSKIFSQAEKAHKKKTGDTKSKKEFSGGFLLAVGPYSGSKLRSFSIRYLFFDEVDAYPQETRNEGDPISLAERRTDAFEQVRKILYISTPLIDHTSRIKPLFQDGDQRYFFVPCKHCGHMQILKWDRIKYEVDERGILVWESVHYECEKCGGHWKNSDKSEFLTLGEWRPAAIPTEPNYRSYHLNALYSPAGMRSWESICQQWIKAKTDPVLLRVFVNTVLGETWIERGEAPRHERIMLRREGYPTGTCPGNAYFLTVGADVQADRIEVEIVAWGKDKESWSVDYIVIPGQTEKIEGEVWGKLGNMLMREYAGLPIKTAFVDAGYNTPTVYEFCDQYDDGVFPVMGDSRVGKKAQLFIEKSLEDRGFQVKRINLFTDDLKQELYSYLSKGIPEPGQNYAKGYCHFPDEYGEKYFRQLTAEEKFPEKDKFGKTRYAWHLKHGRRNEAHDCRVYAMGALLFYATKKWELMYPDDKFSWPDFWKWCEDNLEK